MKKAKVPYFRVVGLFKHLRWRIVGLIVIACIGMGLFAYTPMFTREIFNSIEYSLETDFHIYGFDMRFIYEQLVIFGVLVLFNEIFQVLASVLIVKYENDLADKVTRDFKHKLDLVPISFLESQQPGDLARRCTIVVTVVRNSLQALFRISRTMFFFGVTAIAMFNISWELALVVIASLPLCLITARIVSKRSQKYFNANNSVVLQASAYVDQKVGMHHFFKVHGIEGAEAEYDEMNKIEAKATAGEDFAMAVNGIYVAFIQNLMFLLVTVVFGVLFISGTLPEFGALPAFLVFSNRFLANVVIVTEATNILQGINARAPKIFDILDVPQRLTESEKININQIGDIEFRKISLEHDGEVVLKNISFKIPRGSSVGIVGQTSGGASRLVEILAKMELPTEGEVLIDNVNLTEITRESFYSRIGIAFEKPFIFKGTVAENLLYGVRRALPEHVMATTRRLGSHDFIEQLPLRYETEVSGGSPLLTVSQKQALNVARTMLKASDLVVFDEAKSHADTIGEKEVFETIMNNNPKQTKIFVTHRLASIEKCDQIIFMDKGRIVEMGTHAELMARKKRYYNTYMNN